MRQVTWQAYLLVCATLVATVHVAHAGWKCGPGGAPTTTGCKCPPGKQTGTVGTDHVCVIATPPLSPPQLESPSDGARDINTTTLFIVSTPAWADELEVEICGGGNCNFPLLTRVVPVANRRAPFAWGDLPPLIGAHWWRARSRQNGQPRAPHSALREFTTAALNAGQVTSLFLSKDYAGIVELLSHSTFAREHLEVGQRLADAGRCHEARTVLEQRMPDATLAPKLATLDKDCHLAVAEHVPKREVEDPVPTDAPRSIAIATPANAVRQSPISPVWPLGVGLVVGASSDQDTLIGGRISGGIAVPQGALRALASVLYTRFDDDPENPDSNTQLFALGVSVDYVWMPLPQVAFAAGVGLGIDRQVKNLDREGSSTGWGTLRASPMIVRLLNGRVEVGLHVQYVRTGERGVVLGLAAIDWFPL